MDDLVLYTISWVAAFLVADGIIYVIRWLWRKENGLHGCGKEGAGKL